MKALIVNGSVAEGGVRIATNPVLLIRGVSMQRRFECRKLKMSVTAKKQFPFSQRHSRSQNGSPSIGRTKNSRENSQKELRDFPLLGIISGFYSTIQGSSPH
jgi:hypothetical protein